LQQACNSFLILKQSSVYETEPVGFLQQPWFYNMVIQIDTDRDPRALLQYCQQIELRLGRTREIFKGPRTIDIDILFYGDLTVQQPDLIIPHPEIPNRRFVLEPLNEIAPDLVHPGIDKRISELLLVCVDTSTVRKL